MVPNVGDLNGSVPGCFSLAITGMAAGWPSPVLMKMKKNETLVVLSPEEISWMVSVMFIGHLASPVPCGILMDRLGRKKACHLLAFLPLVSWLLIWGTSSIMCLYVARFTVGLWAGAVTTIVPIYIGEIAEPRLRGSLTVFNHLMRNLGLLIVYIVGPMLSYSTLALSCALLTFLFIISFSYIPESPYYFVMKKQNEEAHKALKWLRGERENLPVDEELRRIKSAIKQQMLVKGTIKDIWYDKGNRKAFIIAEVFAISKKLIGSGVLQAYVSITLPPLTFGLFTPDECVIILGLTSFFSAFASVFLSAHLSRQTLITLSSVGCGITMAFVSVWFYLNYKTTVDVKNYSSWLFVCFVVYNAMFSVGLGPSGMGVKGEMFAANVKAMSSSLTTMIVALLSFFLNKFFLIVSVNYGMYLNFLIFSISCIFTIVFTRLYVPETKGKTLEEIQKILKGTYNSENVYKKII